MGEVGPQEAGAPGDKHLCAFIVSHRDMTVSELKEFLSRQLPDFMIPAFFVQLEKIPVTPNGKVDRKALRETGTWQPKSDADYEPPGTEMAGNPSVVM